MDRPLDDSRVGIIGTGRVAQAMALALRGRSRRAPTIWGRDAGRAKEAADRIGGVEVAPDIATVAERSDLIVLAVADDALEAVIGALAGPVRAGCFVFHASGRSGAAILAPLAERGAVVAAIHPAMTFTGDPAVEVARMAGARFAVTASEKARALAEGIVRALGGAPVWIAEDKRALYHAALCHGANHLVTLIAQARDALAAAGVDDPGALLAPLARAALENGLAKGMDALSGPVLRGDVETIAGHLRAIGRDAPPLEPAYRAMALATLDAVEARGRRAQPAMRTCLTEQDCDVLK